MHAAKQLSAWLCITRLYKTDSIKTISVALKILLIYKVRLHKIEHDDICHNDTLQMPHSA
jgi:hypothetical protein